MAPSALASCTLLVIASIQAAVPSSAPAAEVSTGHSYSFLSYTGNGSVSPDPVVERLLIRKYISSFLSPLRPNQNSQLTYLIKNNSFLLERQAAAVLDAYPNLIFFDFDHHLEQRHDMFYDTYKEQLAEQPDHQQFLTVQSSRMFRLLDKVFTVPRNYRTSDAFRQGCSDYISQMLGDLGLIVGLQSFTPSRFVEQFEDYIPKHSAPDQSLPTGMNMFGIYPGKLWGTAHDRLLIIGAHWDTVETSDGYNDNGSGVVAVLELARLLVESRCQPQRSIVFATFDLEETGAQGSNEFVERFLVPHLQRYSQPSIAGAFIIDTILAQNQTENSQSATGPWTSLDTMGLIEANGYRGDFLAVIQRNGSPDEALSQVLSKHWKHRASDGQAYRLLPFIMHLKSWLSEPDADELVDLVHFIRSDHVRFWFAGHNYSLPSVLLTDTGPDRASMSECYHNPCDSVRPPYTADFADPEFYRRTVQALLDSVIEVSEAKCLEPHQLDHFYNSVSQDTDQNRSASSRLTSALADSVLSLSHFMSTLVLPFL